MHRKILKTFSDSCLNNHLSNKITLTLPQFRATVPFKVWQRYFENVIEKTEYFSF
jgi:hypothetical protein